MGSDTDSGIAPRDELPGNAAAQRMKRQVAELHAGQRRRRRGGR